MDGSRFDRLAAAFAAAPSRRRLLGTALLGLLGWPATVTGKKKNKEKKKEKSCPKGHSRCGTKCCKPDETCQRQKCVHHCKDGKKNQGETDRDCGGSCRNVRKCGRTKFCGDDRDCQSGVCFNFEPSVRICGDCRGDGDCNNHPNGPRCVRNFCRECAIDSDCDNHPNGRRCIDDFCHECAADFDCTSDPGRPFCVATSACPESNACECGECRPGQDSDCPPGEFCDDERGICSDTECASGADCASGCCADGRCRDLSNDPLNCGACGRHCPGEFPQCVMCCNGTCANPPRGGPPGNACVCP